MKHALLTEIDRKRLPLLNSQAGVQDPVAWVRFFNPYGDGVWLVIEFDGNNTFFGLIQINGNSNLGYFSLSALENKKAFIAWKVHPDLPGIERDSWFRPRPLSQSSEVFRMDRVLEQLKKMVAASDKQAKYELPSAMIEGQRGDKDSGDPEGNYVEKSDEDPYRGKNRQLLNDKIREITKTSNLEQAWGRMAQQ